MTRIPRSTVNSLSLLMIVVGVILLSLLIVGQCSSRGTDSSSTANVTVHKAEIGRDSADVKTTDAALGRAKRMKSGKKDKTTVDNTRSPLDEHHN